MLVAKQNFCSSIIGAEEEFCSDTNPKQDFVQTFSIGCKARIFCPNILHVRQDFCSIFLGEKQDFCSSMSVAKQDFCSNVIGAEEELFSDTNTKQDICSNIFNLIQSKIFVQTF